MLEKRIRAILGRKGPKWELELLTDRPPFVKRPAGLDLYRELSEIADRWQIPLNAESSVWPSVAGLLPEDQAGALRSRSCGPRPADAPRVPAAHQPGAADPAAVAIPGSPDGQIAHADLPPKPDSEQLQLGDRHFGLAQRVASSRRGMVATAHHRATEAGVEMLASGGNAIDAAVAAAFALGVCEPAASGLGGQTMMMIHHAASGRTIALDGSSRAPNRANRDEIAPEDVKVGYAAATVPSTPATLRYALETYGTLKLAQVLEPAIRLAEEGYRVSELQNRLTRRELAKLRANSAAPFFLRNGEKPYRAGAVFKQPVLAETLRRLAKRGIRDFYSGRIARQIDDDMIRNGGLIRLDDLAQVPRPIERRPLTCRFGPYRVFTFPPPGAGRTLVEMLNIYQRLPAALRDFESAPGAVALAEIIRTAFLDRQDRPFDPNFYAQVSQKKMLSVEYAKAVAGQVAGRVTS